MSGEFEIRTVAAVPIVIVEREVAADGMPEGIPAVIMPMFDTVYAVLPRGGLGGHNVVIYRPGPDKWTIVVGVTAPEGLDPVPAPLTLSALPAGEIASAVHRGAYDRLGNTHERVQRGVEALGRSWVGVNWEIYGDPAVDPEQTETEVQYLLAPA